MDEISDLTPKNNKIVFKAKKVPTQVNQVENKYLTSTPNEAKNQLKQWPSSIGRQKLSDIIDLEYDDDEKEKNGVNDSFNDIFDSTSIF